MRVVTRNDSALFFSSWYRWFSSAPFDSTGAVLLDAAGDMLDWTASIWPNAQNVTEVGAT
jgi:hypothetical protein